MLVTVLGSSASYSGPGRACSGYLVRTETAKILLDCGNGVLANLGKVIDPLELDAIFITHYHPDHFIDLFAIQALLRYAPQGPADPLPLYLPEGLFERMKCLLSDRGSTELDQAFEVHTLGELQPVKIGDLTVTPLSVVHTEPTFGLRLEHNGSVLAYTADSAPGEHVKRVLDNADVALAEATLPEAYLGAAPHLTAVQAATYAREAKVSRLVLTHIWPTSDRSVVAQEAGEAFGKTVRVASEFDDFEL